MPHPDRQDAAEYEKATEPRNSHRVDDEIVVERTPIVADVARRGDETPPSVAGERGRSERRRVDRMSTGI